MGNEEVPIALILCAEKSDEVIELLELDKGDIRVAKRVKVATCSNFYEKAICGGKS